MTNNQLEIKDTKIIRWIVDDRYRIIRHVALLAGILMIFFFSKEMSQYAGNYRNFRLFCICSSIIMMSYINMYILVPKLFFRGSYLFYLLSLFLLVFLSLTLVSNLLDGFSPKQFMLHKERAEEERGLYEGVIILIPIILVTTMIKLFQRWTRDNERIAELKNITLTMELNELRNQINPHFLFNMLNGIKALVRTDQEKAAAVIMKLSEFLRYQLYENNDEKTTLKSEINFLSNFLELEKLRRDNFVVSVTIDIDIPTINSIFLPPNLFTTFVENAVKHSVNITTNQSYIKVLIDMDGAQLHFNCVNSIDPDYKPMEKNSGLGLANIKRRLTLLYGEEYSCEVNVTKSEYQISLKIPV